MTNGTKTTWMIRQLMVVTDEDGVATFKEGVTGFEESDGWEIHEGDTMVVCRNTTLSDKGERVEVIRRFPIASILEVRQVKRTPSLVMP